MFTQQQLEDAYAQMQQERAEDLRYAGLAAEALGKAVGAPQSVYAQRPQQWPMTDAITPYPTQYALCINLSQYDDWHGWIARLQTAGVLMKPWSGQYSRAPEGEFDLSSDPAFAARSQRRYTVRIEYSDAHAGGY